MSAQSLTLRHIQPHERADVAALFASRQSSRRAQATQTHWLEAMQQHPEDHLTNYRVAVVQGQIVAALHLTERQLHYGRTRLRVACMSNIATHPDYPERAYDAALLRDTLAHVAERGTQIALLDGIADRYDEYGFSAVWPRYTLQAHSRIAADLPQAFGLREVYPDDAERLAALYDRHWGRHVTLSREIDHWRWLLWAYPDNFVIAHDQTGLVQGYLWHDDARKSRVEVVVNHPDALATLIAYEGQRCQRHNASDFMWSLLPDDLIIPYAQQLLPITLSAHYFPSGSWMARLINAAALTRALLPEIRAQAQATDFRFQPDELLLEVESDRVRIGLRGHHETHCQLALRDFVQIVFGSLRPTTFALRHDLQREAVRLLETLFPPRVAGIAACDWF